MSKEYKTLVFKDNDFGRKDMANQLDAFAAQGWELKSKEVSQQGWHFGKTCCLGCIFLPLALLGKKENLITIVLERDTNN